MIAVSKMFSAYDLQSGKYFYIGRNSKSKIECQKKILSYLFVDLFEDQDLGHEKMEELDENEYKEKLEGLEVRIDEHKNRIEGEENK